MKFLKKIEIKDFKSFTNEVIYCDEITSVVGANESGKSNLLEAIYHLSFEKRTKAFEPDDLRIGAEGYPSGEIILKYELEISKELLNNTELDYSSFYGKIINFTKKGKPRDTPIWEVSSNISANSIPDIINIKNKRTFETALKKDGFNKSTITKLCNVGWFFNNSIVDLRKSMFRELLKDKKIEILKSNEKIDFTNFYLKICIFRNINLFKWRFKEEDFLQQLVNINEFVEHPEKYHTIKNMFIISGWNEVEFDNKLRKQTPSVYTNLLKDVMRQINSLIRNQWSSHKYLSIDIQHNSEFLSILLEEPGASTPPEYRSDGLKWFLTFLINFRAQSKNISNYILLIDEPGLYLHPRGQKDALQEIENLAKKNQVIYTTHQTFLINKNKPERVRIIRRINDRAGSIVLKPFYASRVTNKIETKDILTDSLLREALGFKISDNSPINEKNILVEGVFDRELLLVINDYFEIIDLNNVSIISCGRASDIAKHFNLYKNNDLKVVCFYDSDIPGKNALKLNVNASKKEKMQIHDFSDNESETIEDLINDYVFNDTISTLKKKWDSLSNNKILKPRMAFLKKEQYFNDTNKIERKHELENLLLENIKIDIKKNKNNYELFQNILTEIKKRIE